MLASLAPSDAWNLPPKQRLSACLSKGPVHCRVAPSPTGHFHLGTARTALHNALAARASHGSFTLRIDDTDAARNDNAHVQLIHQCLHQLGLVPDTVFHQSSRKHAHAAAIDCLLHAGWAVRDGGAVRLAPQVRTLAPDRFFDLAAGICPITPTLLDHADGLVIARSDGSPVYHLASVVDDIDHGVNFVLRGMDHLSNVPKQVLIAQALAHAGYARAQDFVDGVVFAHVGLIMKDGKKLSKRDHASNLLGYLDGGVPAGALLQWSLGLGWGHPDPCFDQKHPRIDLDDMPTLFAQGGLRPVNCNLNPDRLASIARKWQGKPKAGVG